MRPISIIMNNIGAMIFLRIHEQTSPNFSTISLKPSLTRFGTSAKKLSTYKSFSKITARNEKRKLERKLKKKEN